MSLATGSYTLYAAGVNNASTKVPTFTSGTASSLSNQMDYLWWSDPVTITDASTDVTINFKHGCIQVVWNVVPESGSSLTIDS